MLSIIYQLLDDHFNALLLWFANATSIDVIYLAAGIIRDT